LDDNDFIGVAVIGIDRKLGGALKHIPGCPVSSAIVFPVGGIDKMLERALRQVGKRLGVVPHIRPARKLTECSQGH
jgi:hypothetical protein